MCFHCGSLIDKSKKIASVWIVAFVLFVPVGDCSGFDDGGIGACYTFWLVGLMAVVSMLVVLVKFVGVLQIWLRSIHMSCILPITILMKLICW